MLYIVLNIGNKSKKSKQPNFFSKNVTISSKNLNFTNVLNLAL